MQKEFDKLKEILNRHCQSRQVYYLTNPGNWGDALIRAGTLELLDDINVNYREMTYQQLIPGLGRLPKTYLKGGLVVFGGGGGWCRKWNHGLRTVGLLTLRFKVIVMPSSYEIGYAYPGTIFFCRDRFESKKNMPKAKFCHDLAFYKTKLNVKKNAGSGKGYFLRTDKESSHMIKIPHRNHDISAEGNQYTDIEGFVKEINKFEEIYTDRLHVAIAACILNKKVHLYPGSYFKNKAVYLSSMRDYFENVHYHGDFRLDHD